MRPSRTTFESNPERLTGSRVLRVAGLLVLFPVTLASGQAPDEIAVSEGPLTAEEKRTLVTKP